jgi:hypothetical protein
VRLQPVGRELLRDLRDVMTAARRGVRTTPTVCVSTIGLMLSFVVMGAAQLDAQIDRRRDSRRRDRPILLHVCSALSKEALRSRPSFFASIACHSSPRLKCGRMSGLGHVACWPPAADVPVDARLPSFAEAVCACGR